MTMQTGENEHALSKIPIQAVKQKGGTAETYIQWGMPSDDYDETFPGHMLNNDISKLHRSHTHIHPMVTYDATVPNFHVHMRKVWANFKDAGFSGVKFDYPDIVWSPEGGFEDKYATTASVYRKSSQLCREGLCGVANFEKTEFLRLIASNINTLENRIKEKILQYRF